MKYMPILRYRESEKKTLENVTRSSKILPLIEVIQEKRKSNMNSTCFDDIIEYLNSSGTKLLIDFPMYIKIKRNTLPGVLNFIPPLLANPSLRLAQFDKFKNQNIIPVVSYNPNTPLYKNGLISSEFTHLRPSFNQIALRVFLTHSQQVLVEAEKYLQPNDIIIIDLGETPHDDPSLYDFYSMITTYAKKYDCKSVLVRSAINPDITNTGLTNNSVVKEIDNGLLQNYQRYGFEAFGDYCGIKKDELTEGGMTSPGCIFYHWWSNTYFGHKGVYKQANTYTTMVTPSLIQSQQWSDYMTKSSPAHVHSCPGCKTIDKIANSTENGNSGPKWKVIISSHYLHTMEEFL